MALGPPEVEHRIYPIGAFSEREVIAIRTDSLCADETPVDRLMEEWRDRSRTFERQPAPDLDVKDSELLPLTIREETADRIDAVLTSYRDYLPPAFALAMVPIKKLIMPQMSISREHASAALNGAHGLISNDENAAVCLGKPLTSVHIEGSYLGSPKATPYPNAINYLYQFSCDDPNLRVIPMMPFKPLMDVDLATHGSQFSYPAKAVPVTVGMGLPLVHVLKVPRSQDKVTGETVSKLVIANGIHRVFRLAELGNTHAAALVQTMNYEEIPNPFVEVQKERLLGPKPLTFSTFMDDKISRPFMWKKSKRVIKVQVIVNQEISQVP